AGLSPGRALEPRQPGYPRLFSQRQRRAGPSPAARGRRSRYPRRQLERLGRHFGPLVSGSAFADLPRASVPVPIIYLALFENWPGDLRKTYKWNIPEHPQTLAEYQQLIARHGLASGPIEEGFPADYQDRFSAVAR